MWNDHCASTISTSACHFHTHTLTGTYTGANSHQKDITATWGVTNINPEIEMSSFCLKALWESVLLCNINDYSEIKHVCYEGDIFLSYLFVLAVICCLKRCHNCSNSIKISKNNLLYSPFILTWRVIEYWFNSTMLLMICFSFILDIDIQDKFYS